MNSLLTFKKWTSSKPYFWLFLMASCFIFFLVFNFGLDTFKKSRGLASSEDSVVNKEMSKVVVNNISSVIEGRAVQHGSQPSPQEQFMYGYLQGKYKAVYKNDKFAYIELKENHQPLEFSKNRRAELMRNVQAVFVMPGTTLENMTSTRQPASKSFSYEMTKRGELKGLFKMVFSEADELLAIKVSDLSL
jgi:hypothetical protein